MEKINDDKKSNFLEKIKTKSKEFGIVITSELLDNLNQTTSLLQASLGNELVIATFAPMIPQLIFDEVKKRLFTIEIADLGNRLSQVKQDLNHDFINSDEGRKLFQQSVEEIINNAEKDKIEYIKKFITSSFTLEDPQEIKLKKYREILIQMTSLDIQLLQLFCKPQEFIHQLRPIKNKLEDEGKATYQLLLPIDMHDYNFKVDEGLFLASYKSLTNWNLIHHENKKFKKEDEVEPENTAIYTLDNYWGVGQADYYITHDRRHAKKSLKDNSKVCHSKDAIVEMSLSALTMAFVTNFGWDLMCMIDESIQPVSIDEDLELEH